MKTPKPLLALRMVFPLAASLIVLLLGEGIARGSLSADVFASFIKLETLILNFGAGWRASKTEIPIPHSAVTAFWSRAS